MERLAAYVQDGAEQAKELVAANEHVAAFALMRQLLPVAVWVSKQRWQPNTRSRSQLDATKDIKALGHSPYAEHVGGERFAQLRTAHMHCIMGWERAEDVQLLIRVTQWLVTASESESAKTQRLRRDAKTSRTRLLRFRFAR